MIVQTGQCENGLPRIVQGGGSVDETAAGRLVRGGEASIGFLGLEQKPAKPTQLLELEVSGLVLVDENKRDEAERDVAKLYDIAPGGNLQPGRGPDAAARAELGRREQVPVAEEGRGTAHRRADALIVSTIQIGA